ncbi:MAG TPA: response regulator [Rickettsiales bacterium]|nr:response regulator [Rickettsiales bacterium]
MYKILAVDDEPDALKIMRIHLEEAGHNVVTAKNGQEALEVLHQHPDVSLILMDRMMPEMDGLAALLKIKEKGSRFSHIPVIMQTAKVQDYDIYAGIDAGAINYMLKPYTREMMLATIDSIMHDVEAIKEHMYFKRYMESPNRKS